MPSRTWSALILRHESLRSSRMAMPRRFRPGIEHLEDRTTPTTLFVTNTDDSGDGSLRDRIADAVSGDTIAFQTSGTIALLSGLTIDKNVTIDGPGDDTITVSGNDAVRIFTVAAGFEAAFDGLILRDGLAAGSSGGGAILALDGAAVIVTDCTFIDNTATLASGGAIAGQSNVTLDVSNSTFVGNTVNLVDASGGAIANSGTLIVSACTFAENAAWIGGAIAFNGSGEITDCDFTDNDADDFGGAIYVNTVGSTLDVVGSTFTGNTAGTQGGALYNLAGTVTVLTSTFTENDSGGGGGAIENDSGDSSLTVERSTFVGNTALTNGAAIECGGEGSSLTVINCTFVDNVAGGAGGGIANGGVFEVTHSTFTANTDVLHAGGIVNWGVGTATIYNTIVAGNSGADYYNATFSGAATTSAGTNLYGSSAGVAWDDSDIQTTAPLLGPLQDNGGPTETISLLPDSPALAAGNVADAPATDQRGFARVINGLIDIGAWQTQVLAPSALSYRVNTDTVIAGINVSPTGADVEVTLTAAQDRGVITLSSLAGLTFTIGDGVSDPTMTFSGARDDVNAALDNLVFRSNQDTPGPEQLVVEVGAVGGPPTDTHTVALNLVSGLVTLQDHPTLPGVRDLVIYGTAGDDLILVMRQHGSSKLRVLGGGTPQEFVVTGRVLVFGQDGNDHIAVLKKVEHDTVLDGGAGDDRLRAGSGVNLVIGGQGDDDFQGANQGRKPAGNSMRDVFIGDAGADTLRSRSGEDLLIGDLTAWDADRAALDRVMQEWSRTDADYATRIDHLKNGGGLNGPFFLDTTTVLDDGAADQLSGGKQLDWFWRKLGLDAITDLEALETVDEIA